MLIRFLECVMRVHDATDVMSLPLPFFRGASSCREALPRRQDSRSRQPLLERSLRNRLQVIKAFELHLEKKNQRFPKKTETTKASENQEIEMRIKGRR
jgi:hypothetical protein